MTWRNRLVRPLGLKVEDANDYGLGKVGFFPVVSESPGRVVFGLEDRHLDFRAVIDVVSADEVSHVTVTTLVRLHNVLGRAYLTAILPFHRLIVRAWLDNLTKRPADDADSAMIAI
jgi:hypothetical protein